MTAPDPFDLDRFVAAQDCGVYERAIAEVRAGRKAGHWMWGVFPQIADLGQSATSRHFAIRSVPEARVYLAHRLLGPRLTECALALTQRAGRSADQVFGPVDAQNLRSSMTLFRHADPGEPLFDRVLALYFDGQADQFTDAAVAAAGDGDLR